MGHARAGGRAGRRDTPASSASATRPSRARPAAGRATRTARPATSTRSARPRTTTPAAPRRSTAAIARRRRRSASAAAVASANLACSGARTYTQPFSSGNDFKPGLDFYDDGAGHIGQARALQQYAATHNVKMVVALIGANDYGFADIVQQCVLDWLTSPSWWKNYCHDDSSMTSKFTAANVAAITTRVANAFLNLRTAMRNAGYADGVVDAARADLLLAAAARRADPLLAERLHAPERRRLRRLERRRRLGQRHRRGHAQRHGAQRRGGQPGMTNIALFDAQNALVGHRLCENTDGLLEEQGLATWRSPGAADKLGVGLADPHHDDAVRPLPAPGGRCTRPTGASWRCATACARPTTPARRAAAPAPARRPGSTARASRT